MSERIIVKHRANFDTLCEAVKDNHVLLMDCVEKKTGEHVAVVCTWYMDEDGQVVTVPFAQMYTENPYDLLLNPMEYDKD